MFLMESISLLRELSSEEMFCRRSMTGPDSTHVVSVWTSPWASMTGVSCRSPVGAAGVLLALYHRTLLVRSYECTEEIEFLGGKKLTWGDPRGQHSHCWCWVAVHPVQPASLRPWTGKHGTPYGRAAWSRGEPYGSRVDPCLGPGLPTGAEHFPQGKRWSRQRRNLYAHRDLWGTNPTWQRL